MICQSQERLDVGHEKELCALLHIVTSFQHQGHLRIYWLGYLLKSQTAGRRCDEERKSCSRSYLVDFVHAGAVGSINSLRRLVTVVYLVGCFRIGSSFIRERREILTVKNTISLFLGS